jgi:tetratricopeptide (TPR) repeat protein
VALAIAVRLWGVADRLPDPTLGINILDDSVVEETDRTTMGRAWLMWGGGTRDFDFNPHTGGWPALSFYVALALQMVFKASWAVSHSGGNSKDFAEFFTTHVQQAFLLARIAGVIIGAATVFLTYRLGTRLAGREVGAVAALFLALNPLHIQTSQHVADPNLLALVFVLLAAIAMTRVAEGGSLRDSVMAGAMIGLAGACKYVPLVLVVPLAVAHGRDFFKSRAYGVALLAVAAALFVGSPFTFLDWKTTLRDIGTQRSALFSDWVGQTAFPFSLPTYIAVSLPHVMGWIAYLLGLAGMGLLWRRGTAARAVALIPGVMVLANGALKAAQERYMLVAIPMLFIAASLAVWTAGRWVAERVAVRRAAILAPALLALTALAWPLPEYVGLRRALALPDTRHVARRWVLENIPAGAPMAVELYGPVFRADERSIVIWPFFATRTPLVRPAYHWQFLDGLEYYLTSQEISRRFAVDSLAYPVESAYYRWLHANAPVVWKSDPKRMSGPVIEIRRIPSQVSTRAERDSVFTDAVPTPSAVTRVGLWCGDYAALFGRLHHNDRAEEWAERGLRVGAARMTVRLINTLTYAKLNLEKYAEAEQVAALGLTRAPNDAILHLYRGIALQELERGNDALDEFRKAYEISHDGRALIHIGQVLAELGRYEEALTTLRQIPPGHVDRFSAARETALILINGLHRPEEGLAALREAAAISPDPEQTARIDREIVRIEGLLRAER